MTDLLIWYGELTGARRLRRRGLLFVVWGLGWLMLLLALPAVALAAAGFAQRDELGNVIWQPTLENFKRVSGFGIFGWTPDNLWILGRSAVVAAVTTAAAVVLAYPLAFYIANKPERTRHFWLSLVIIPFCTNMVVRTCAWMLLLSGQLPPAQAAQWAGWIEPNAALQPGMLAVYLGMISTFLPFTVLPLYTSVERLDWSLIEAAGDLYASRWRIFRHAILPQTLPGLSVALVLTFIPAMGMFVVPRLLGGSKYMLVGDLIEQQFNESRDYPFGAALSMGLMVLTLLGLWVTWRWSDKVEPG